MTPPGGEWIAPAQFWSLYYSGRIVRMRRSGEGAVSGLYDDYPAEMILPEEKQFACSHQALMAYEYADWKFSAPISNSLSLSLINVLVSPVMAQESAVNWLQLNFAARVCGLPGINPVPSYNSWRQSIVARLRRFEVQLQDLAEAFIEGTPSEASAEVYRKHGDVKLLGLDRQLPLKAFGFLLPYDYVLDLITSVTMNPHEDLDTQRIAVWALGRHNHKGALRVLMNLLNSPAAANLSVPIEQALQFLCSGEELIPLQYENEAAFWGRVTDRSPLLAADWVQWDAASVFWEKRLRAALDPALEDAARRRLQLDEVPAVRLAASQEIA